ncbi:hypothetical protein L6452_35342 [Arctium lappa]|uniref:Uncharacterized protein n=1 Tax=Arctium lappa TaxID=4217 RepID=A0ACB8Y698_ARCLA|nr:hypothetical protein L6452_35342 [Arctium lappa]
MESFDPPFQEFYKKLFDNHFINQSSSKNNRIEAFQEAEERDEFELPLIDLSRLNRGGFESEECKREIAEASQEWGFFQVVNHGVSLELLERTRHEQVKAFKKPFREKANGGHRDLNFPAGSYRWGTPSATCLRQLAWSEAFHVPLTEIYTAGGATGLSMTTKQYATIVSNLAEKLAEILAEKLGKTSDFFKKNCVPSMCYIRMSRYPACPISPQVFGLMPHTDSDFLTILHQDQIGGLQLQKNGKWIDVHPNQETLLVIIGDLFQAWSNGAYKSLEHRVVANKQFERFSTAYFLCPSSETVIESCGETSIYRRFSFLEFRQQVQDDVKRFGHKIGLSRKNKNLKKEMISSSASSLSNLPPSPTPPNPGPPPVPKQTAHRLPESDHRKLNKGSSQLIRWSRARAIRSGVKLDRSAQRTLQQNTEVVDRRSGDGESSNTDYSSEEDDGCVAEMEEAAAAGAKQIYMVSDGTGWTAEHSVNAALGQFEHCFVDRGCPVNTHLFSGIEDVEQLMEIIKQAAREGAMLIYTLADENMAASARHACKRWGVPSTDLLSPITEAISLHLGVSPSGLPRGAPGRKFPLTEDYFKRIDAIEFTIKQDDGALPANLHKADIVLVGVSRTGKTPLSIYLSQKGFKVANVPLVMGVALPKTLFEIDQEKVFALTINPVVLQTIRRARAKSLGFTEQVRTNYSEMDHVREELDFACKIFAQNPTWPVIEVTGKAIEETAVAVLRLYQDRKTRCSMPRISKRY